MKLTIKVYLNLKIKENQKISLLGRKKNNIIKIYKLLNENYF